MEFSIFIDSDTRWTYKSELQCLIRFLKFQKEGQRTVMISQYSPENIQTIDGLDITIVKKYNEMSKVLSYVGNNL